MFERIPPFTFHLSPFTFDVSIGSQFLCIRGSFLRSLRSIAAISFFHQSPITYHLSPSCLRFFVSLYLCVNSLFSSSTPRSALYSRFFFELSALNRALSFEATS